MLGQILVSQSMRWLRTVLQSIVALSGYPAVSIFPDVLRIGFLWLDSSDKSWFLKPSIFPPKNNKIN